MYAELERRRAAGAVLCGRARYINLDEYVGLGARDALSYVGYLQRHFLGPARVGAQRLHLLRGDAPDLQAECRAADAALAGWGGLDLALLGLGENGHIAFNEPGSDWNATTHVVALDECTRAAQRRQAGAGAPIPERGITLGIATIRAARQVVLLVRGAAKSAALAALLRGRADPRWPVTSLIGHPDFVVIAEAALRPAGVADFTPRS
jgi:glucosamine-6-phosphate deaminase